MEVFELAIVGGGPAGLSAAINGASELSRVVLFDSGRSGPRGSGDTRLAVLGGQALGSSCIENYMGFPGGVSGPALMEAATRQARMLGTEIRCPERVDSLKYVGEGLKLLTTKEGSEVLAKAVILANGLSYRRLPVPGIQELLGKGVLYGAPTSSALELGPCTACVVGGANSAGQAVIKLSKNPDCRIKVLIRGDKGIEAQMSKYLVDRIHSCSNVEVLQGVEVVRALGTERLTAVALRRGNMEDELPTDHLFLFIGAAPKVEWLQDAVLMDDKRFIRTDVALPADLGTRPRFPFECSIPGVFVAGDIRVGSVKRASAAVGEGSSAVASAHHYLADAHR